MNTCWRAVAFATAVAGTAAALAGATAPAKNGQIAFVRIAAADATSATSEIFVTNAKGSGERRITRPPSGFADVLPDWAPDGSRIVFQRCAPAGGACLVWSVKPDGRGLKRLSPPCPTGEAPPACVDDRSPVYSPDGKQIAFVRTKSRPVLMLADATLGRARPLPGLGTSRGSPYAITWSPDGRRLGFASVNDSRSKARPADGRAVYVVGVNGKGVRRVTPWALAAGRPDWSPDGSRILFSSDSNRLGGVGVDLFTVRPDGSGLSRTTAFEPSVRILGASYSPDGASIVLSTDRAAVPPSAGPDIVAMRTDGKGVPRTTTSDGWDVSPDWGPRS